MNRVGEDHGKATLNHPEKHRLTQHQGVVGGHHTAVRQRVLCSNKQIKRRLKKATRAICQVEEILRAFFW